MVSRQTLETVPMHTIIKAIIGIRSTLNSDYMTPEECLSECSDKDGVALKFMTGLPDEDNNAILKAFAAGEEPYEVIQTVLDQYKSTDDINPWYDKPDDDMSSRDMDEDKNIYLRCIEVRCLYRKSMKNSYLENCILADTEELIRDFICRFDYPNQDKLFIALRETEEKVTPSPERCKELQCLLTMIEESMQYCEDVHDTMMNGSSRMYHVPHVFPDEFMRAEGKRRHEFIGHSYEYSLFYNLLIAHNKISIHLARAGVMDVCFLDYEID